LGRQRWTKSVTYDLVFSCRHRNSINSSNNYYTNFIIVGSSVSIGILHPLASSEGSDDDKSSLLYWGALR
jgi:hypothetical protein